MQNSPFHITGFTLKILAIVGMTCNHVAHGFFYVMPHWLTFLLYSMGGITYPIMAYLLVEGYLHTSNLKKYATRLGIFALVSQIPYSLMFGWRANVLITLLLALVLLWAWDNIWPKKKIAFIGLLIAVEVLSWWCDWAVSGPLIVFAFYFFRKRHAGAKGVALTMLIPYAFHGVPALVRFGIELVTSINNQSWVAAQLAAGEFVKGYWDLSLTGEPLYMTIDGFTQLCAAGYALIGFTLAWFFIMFYNGQRGRSMKWFFYAYYPLHLFIIWGIREILKTIL